MKAFPITENELLALGAVQGFSAIFFTLAGTLFGFYLDISQAADFAGEQKTPEMQYWEGLSDAAFYGAIDVTP